MQAGCRSRDICAVDSMSSGRWWGVWSGLGVQVPWALPAGSPGAGAPADKAMRPLQVTEDHTYMCTFPNSVLHRGANLTVNVTCDGDVFLQVLTFANPGREGSGAVNFSCLIYNVRFMNCSWAPGPAAPADVKYRLFWESRHEADAECVHYILGPTGTRVGCHFDQLGKPQRTDNYFFLVNGTSRETAIPFLDFTPFKAVQIEKYDPPRNITITYNRSHHIIRWEHPEIRFDLSSHMLYYELDIQTPVRTHASVNDPHSACCPVCPWGINRADSFLVLKRNL
ncbi:granulocyte-macrophage colony-stimulating factor receptor subunit alpha-like [Herpailurus yagouaroundi]|uniref:granulocyte-macrophage colony-stimulating factor receptor subunit alpha-like n=1 Tax=Herpailurus yagouaroundi TaxID=1608482 RepID=UPI001AD7153B|nr:granulocyte-macrophage colony-stimulating factor receptor subunit alpha-like [Puma yagouaroundi]